MRLAKYGVMVDISDIKWLRKSLELAQDKISEAVRIYKAINEETK